MKAQVLWSQRQIVSLTSGELRTGARYKLLCDLGQDGHMIKAGTEVIVVRVTSRPWRSLVSLEDGTLYHLDDGTLEGSFTRLPEQQPPTVRCIGATVELTAHEVATVSANSANGIIAAMVMELRKQLAKPPGH